MLKKELDSKFDNNFDSWSSKFDTWTALLWNDFFTKFQKMNLEMYSGPSQISKIKYFGKVINDWKSVD